ncbi:Uma2 family endonuclease, partial [Cronbergia sp. UHCC 0137]|nr:Uma2 family endonuclease [Cronbergia sp. UHCC 0137]
FYAIYEVKKASVEVYHLVDGKYEKMPANERGHYPIPQIGVELGIQQDTEIPWLRWWSADGEMLLSGNERADQEKQRADQERIAKEQAEAIALQERREKEQERREKEQERREKERLMAYLRSQGIDPEQIP